MLGQFRVRTGALISWGAHARDNKKLGDGEEPRCATASSCSVGVTSAPGRCPHAKTSIAAADEKRYSTMTTDPKNSAQKESNASRSELVIMTLALTLAVWALVDSFRADEPPPRYVFRILSGVMFALGSIFFFRESRRTGRGVWVVSAIFIVASAIVVLAWGMMLAFGRVPF